MKLMAVLALACGFTAAPMVAVGTASALPGTCDGTECVPYVDRNVDPATPCVFGSRYPFGLDATGNTLLCTAENEWVAAAPLVRGADLAGSLRPEPAGQGGPVSRRSAADV